jgi:hypothetical protein
MTHPAGEAGDGTLRLDFDRRVKLDTRINLRDASPSFGTGEFGSYPHAEGRLAGMCVDL